MSIIVEAMLSELKQEAVATRRLLERVPGDKLAWKPHPKSMSLGQLALHVASLPGAIADFLMNDQLVVDGVDFEPAAAKSSSELLPALEKSVAKANDFLGALDEKRAMATWKLIKGGKEILAAPRLMITRSLMLNHWYHHRGQLGVYLRQLNVSLPAVYGRSADENPLGL